jgi:cytochrome o ubiquinol oxidase subunit 3
MTHAHKTEMVNLGFWVYLMSDCVLFAGLFAAYAVLHNSTAGGPVGAEFISLPYVFWQTVALLTSSFTCGLMLLYVHKNRSLFWVFLVVTAALGALFVGLEVNEFLHLIGEGAGPSRSAFLSAFFTLVGTHGLHVSIGLLWLAALVVHALMRGLTEDTVRKLGLFALFWHFLDIVWICIFTFVYLSGLL